MHAHDSLGFADWSQVIAAAANVHIHAHTNVGLHADMCVYMCTYVHAHMTPLVLLTGAKSLMLLLLMFTHIHKCMQACMHACAHTCAHTCTHTTPWVSQSHGLDWTPNPAQPAPVLGRLLQPPGWSREGLGTCSAQISPVLREALAVGPNPLSTLLAQLCS